MLTKLALGYFTSLMFFMATLFLLCDADKLITLLAFGVFGITAFGQGRVLAISEGSI